MTTSSIVLTSQQMLADSIEISIADLLALPQAETILIVDAIDESLVASINASGSIALAPEGRQVVTLRNANVRSHTIELQDGTEIDRIDVRGGRVYLHDWRNDTDTEE